MSTASWIVFDVPLSLDRARSYARAFFVMVC